MSPQPKNLGELRRSPWSEDKFGSRTVRQELRENLLQRLEKGEPIFSGVHGYDDGIYTIDQLGAYEGLLDIAPSYPHPEAPFGDPAGYRHLVHESLAVIVGNARTPPPLLMTEASLGAGRSPLSPGGLTIYSSIFRQ